MTMIDGASVTACGGRAATRRGLADRCGLLDGLSEASGGSSCRGDATASPFAGAECDAAGSVSVRGFSNGACSGGADSRAGFSDVNAAGFSGTDSVDANSVTLAEEAGLSPAAGTA